MGDVKCCLPLDWRLQGLDIQQWTREQTKDVRGPLQYTWSTFSGFEMAESLR